MLVGCKYITTGAFSIKKINVAVLHADNEVYIEKRLFAALSFVVFNGVVGFTIIAVLIPPVNVLRIGFKEFDKFLFGI